MLRKEKRMAKQTGEKRRLMALAATLVMMPAAVVAFVEDPTLCRKCTWRAVSPNSR